MLIDQILALPAGSVRVADIGAAFYGEVPPYQRLLDTGLGRLFAFSLTVDMPTLCANVSDQRARYSIKL